VRILFVVPYAPTVIRTRPYNFLRGLARRGHTLTLATLWQNEAEREALGALAREGIAVHAHRLTRARTIGNCLQAALGSGPLQAAYAWVPELAAEAWKLAEGSRCDVVHVEHLRGARYALALRAQAPLVWDSVDCISHLFEQARVQTHSLQARLMSSMELGRTRRYEGRLVRRFERVLVSSALDREALERLAADLHPRPTPPRASPEALPSLPLTCSEQSWPLAHRRPWVQGRWDIRATTCPCRQARWGFPRLDFRRGCASALAIWARREASSGLATAAPPETGKAASVVVVPNGVDLDAFGPPAGARLLDTLVFSGKMGYHANVTAVLYFVRDILPLIWRERPQTKLWIVGQSPPAVIKNLAVDPRITVTGQVPEMRPYLAGAAVAICPVVYGAGIQNKVLEAMACATPVVSTPASLSALSAEPESEALAGGTAPEFARQVLRLLGDPELAGRIGAAGRRFVERGHSWDAVAQQLIENYNEVIDLWQFRKPQQPGTERQRSSS